eukprot:g39965.t1
MKEFKDSMSTEEALRADQVTNHVVHSFFGCDYRPLSNWGVVTRETALSIVQGLFGLELLGAKRLLTSRLAHFAKRTTKPNYPDVLVLGNYDPPIIKDASGTEAGTKSDDDEEMVTKGKENKKKKKQGKQDKTKNEEENDESSSEDEFLGEKKGKQEAGQDQE